MPKLSGDPHLCCRGSGAEGLGPWTFLMCLETGDLRFPMISVDFYGFLWISMNNEYLTLFNIYFPLDYPIISMMPGWVEFGYKTVYVTESQDPLGILHMTFRKVMCPICLCPFLIGLTMLTRNGHSPLEKVKLWILSKALLMSLSRLDDFFK